MADVKADEARGREATSGSGPGPSALGKNDEPSFTPAATIEDPLSLFVLSGTVSDARFRTLRRQEVLWRWGTAAGSQWRPARRASEPPGEREELLEAGPGIGRVARCGRYPRSGAMVSIRKGGFGYFIASLARCGSIWSCPSCSPAIRSRREAELRAGLERFAADMPKGSVRMATLTVPHRPSDALEDLLDGLGTAWGRMVAGKAWTAACERYGLVGWLRATEVTVGGSGWHPHLHVLILRRTGAGEAEFLQWFTERWRVSCQKAGLRTPSRARGVDLRDVGDSAAGYMTRIVSEAVRADYKTGRGSNLAPLQLLDLAGTPDEAWARRRFREYEVAVHGRHALAVSKGLRRYLKDLPTSDLAAAEADHADDGEPQRGLVLSPEQWAALRLHPVARQNLLALLESNQPDRAQRLLDSLTVIEGVA